MVAVVEDYVKANDGAWPRSWADLEKLPPREWAMFTWPVDSVELQELDAIEFAADPAKLARQRPEQCAAINELQGQRLVGAAVNTETAITRFTFDLDTVLEVRRENRRSTDELWLLNGADKYQRSLRGNGKFSRVKLK